MARPCAPRSSVLPPQLFESPKCWPPDMFSSNPPGGDQPQMTGAYLGPCAAMCRHQAAKLMVETPIGPCFPCAILCQDAKSNGLTVNGNDECPR